MAASGLISNCYCCSWLSVWSWCRGKEITMLLPDSHHCGCYWTENSHQAAALWRNPWRNYHRGEAWRCRQSSCY
ncbi:hypothetical protein OIU84_028920 [Salix udensis]|uniref:Uncharacterized protein n=1 Tax=Salix udensis TaxID=889485 RepID=A0AAD6KDV6_9ROSI|nr:hypothetical protein OIU84_028920 [Salix udensis]